MFDIVLSSFTLTLVLLIFLLVGYWILKSSFQKTKHNKADTEFVDCKNPNCVRCTLYSEVTSAAKAKLEKYIDMNLQRKSSFDRIEESFLNTQDTPIRKNDACDSDEYASFQRPKVFRLRDLTSRPLLSKETMAMDVDILRENFEVIYSEFCMTLEDYHNELWLRNDTPTGKWSVFHLVNQGKIVEKNLRVCPQTFSVVRTMPSLMSSNVFGNVAFSIVEPETVISKHHGPTNIRVRCHLGLVTPPSCTLTVCVTPTRWSRGDCLVFDDSYLHGVRHDGSPMDGIRAVLIVDLWHPGVTEEERVALDYIFAPS